MIKHTTRAALICATLLATAAVPATAALVEVRYAGTVTSLQNGGAFGGVFAVGQQVDGRFTFDDATPDGTADPRLGSFANAFTDYSVTIGGIGGITVSGSAGSIAVQDGFSGNTDNLNVFVYPASGPMINGMLPEDVNNVLWSTAGTLLASDAIPLTLDTALVSSQINRLAYVAPGSPGVRAYVYWNVTAWAVDAAAVDTPEGAPLLAGALALLALRQRRRRKARSTR